MASQDQADGDESRGLGGLFSGFSVASLAAKAKLAGKQAVVPMIQQAVREELVDILNDHEPEELRGYIDVGYPLLENELPDGYKDALGNVGPNFEDEIIQMVNDETVLSWLHNPEQWMDDDVDEERLEDIRRVGHILENYSGGREWLNQQIIALYRICNLIE